MEVWEEVAKEEVINMTMKTRTDKKKRDIEKKDQCFWYHVRMWGRMNIKKKKKNIIIEKVYLT